MPKQAWIKPRVHKIPNIKLVDFTPEGLAAIKREMKRALDR